MNIICESVTRMRTHLNVTVFFR